MKVPLSWLRAHLDTDADAPAIAAALTGLGLEVEAVHDPAAALAPFRIARVLECAPHPNADRLRALRVDAGNGRLLSVVCGAPNARAGMLGVLALPGAHIPGTGITLKAGEIRGVASEAMLLSAREMGLGDDHSGIVDLPADAPVGEAYARWAGLDDPVIEIGVTPNRGDALSVHGVARDLAAAGIGRLKALPDPAIAVAYPSPLLWRIDDPRACRWVLGRAVRGVRNGPSPKWLADWLLGIGQRPINALVDVTNLFTFGLGRPLHVFDVAKVHGDTLTLRMAHAGETLAALNGRSYALTPDDGVIADADGAESLGGIIGGERTGCDEATTECFIECAVFDPVRIALAGRRHDVRTEARTRFERGIDQALPPRALDLATATIIELCGGEASAVSEAGAPNAWQRDATLRFARLAALGGDAVLPEEAVAILDRLGFAARHRDAERVTVAVPSWRNDVAQPMVLDPAPGLAPDAGAVAAVDAECDLIEEVLRIRGLDRVPPVSMPPTAAVPAPALRPAGARAALARRTLAARGLLECVSFAFLDGRTAALFGAGEDAPRLDNPIAADLDRMRPTPLASLALAAARNAARGQAAVGLLELGGGYAADNVQQTIAAALRVGSTPRHPLAPARPFDAYDAKGDALAVLLALGVAPAALSVTTDAPGWYHPGRSGTVMAGPKAKLATFGELHPRVLAALDLPGPAVACEVFLDAIADPKRRARRSPPTLSPLMPVRRDFAFLVAADVAADRILRAASAGARKAAPTLTPEVALFDRYAGAPLPDGQISLGVELTLHPSERTLGEAEIDAVGAAVVAAVTQATGAVLRG